MNLLWLLYGWENGKAKIKGVQNHINDGGFIIFQKGEKTHKQKQIYVSPGVTKYFPKKEIK